MSGLKREARETDGSAQTASRKKARLATHRALDCVACENPIHLDRDDQATCGCQVPECCHGQKRRFYSLERIQHCHRLVGSRKRDHLLLTAGDPVVGEVDAYYAHWEALPDEILASILARLPCLIRVGRAASVCRRWRLVALDARSTGPLCVTAETSRHTACTDAAQLGHTECAFYAIAAGGDLGHDAMHAAISGGYLETVVALCEAGCPWPHDVFCDVIAQGRLDMIAYIVDAGYRVQWSRMTTLAAQHGRVGVLRWIGAYHQPLLIPDTSGVQQPMDDSERHRVLRMWRWNASTCAEAAANGHVECLAYLHGQGCPWDGRTCTMAARGGHIECLDFARKHGCPCRSGAMSEAARRGDVSLIEHLIARGCPWDESVCEAAAEGGHLECLCFLRERGCPWDADTCAAAAAGGHLACLEYAREQGCAWDDRACVPWYGLVYMNCMWYAYENGCACSIEFHTVVTFGSVGDVKRAHRHGVQWSASDIALAASLGDLDTVRYMHKQGCPWDQDACVRAAREGRVECLRYLYEEGCPRNPVVCAKKAATGGHMAVLRYLYKQHGSSAWRGSVLTNAIRMYHIDSVRLLCRRGCFWPVDLASALDRTPDDRVLMCALEHGYDHAPLGPRMDRGRSVRLFMAIAVRTGSVCAMRLLEPHIERAWWTPGLFKRALQGPHPNMLVYLVEKQCPWNGNACRDAAASGDLRSLAFLHERGCPWDASVCSTAAMYGSLTCLAYAHQHGCPWDARTCFMAIKGDSLPCFDYAHRHGCAWNDSAWYEARASFNPAFGDHMLRHGYVPPSHRATPGV